MRSIRAVCSVFTVLFFCYSSLAMAEVEKKDARTLNLEARPIDVAMSADGNHIFILAEGGKVIVVDRRGSIQDTLTVSESMVSIETSPNGDLLLLADNKRNVLEVVNITFAVDIDVSGLPFKGPADAPVVVAVFSDYQ